MLAYNRMVQQGLAAELNPTTPFDFASADAHCELVVGVAAHARHPSQGGASEGPSSRKIIHYNNSCVVEIPLHFADVAKHPKCFGSRLPSRIDVRTLRARLKSKSLQ